MFQVNFFHTDESLQDHHSLVDVAYIYSWRRVSQRVTLFGNSRIDRTLELTSVVPKCLHVRVASATKRFNLLISLNDAVRFDVT